MTDTDRIQGARRDLSFAIPHGHPERDSLETVLYAYEDLRARLETAEADRAGYLRDFTTASNRRMEAEQKITQLRARLEAAEAVVRAANRIGGEAEVGGYEDGQEVYAITQDCFAELKDALSA